MSAEFYMPPLTRVNRILISLSVSFFLLGNIAYYWLHLPAGIYLGLSWEGILQGRVYQLLTYPFWELGLFPMLFQSLLLWWTGGDLEQRWGTRFYLFFVVSTLIAMGVLFLGLSVAFNAWGILSGSSLVGMSGLTLGMLFAYARIFPDRQFSFFMLFPMKAKYFCLLLAAIEIYQVLFSSLGSSLWGHLLGAVWAVGLLKFLAWRHYRRLGKGAKSQRQAEELRKSFKVLSGDQNDKNDGPKYWH